MNYFYNFVSQKAKVFSTLFALLIFSVTMILPLFVQAQPTISVPMTPRTSPYANWQTIYNIKGDFSMIGNTNLTLRNYGPLTNNNSQVMDYVNKDPLHGNQLLNSSSATLVFNTDGNPAVRPECSNILYAGLYWTGRNYNGGTSNATHTVDVTRTVTSTVPVLVNQNVNQANGPILQSNLVMNVTFGALNPTYITYYSFGDGNNAVVFRWQPEGSSGNSGPDGPIHVSYTGMAGPWTLLTTTLMSPAPPATTIGRTFSTPITFTYGTFTITVSGLVKSNNARNNVNLTTPVPHPYAVMHVSGQYYPTYEETTTYYKDRVKLRHTDDNQYHEFSASGAFSNNIYYPLGTAAGAIFVGYEDVTEYVKAWGLGEYWVADIALREGLGDGTGFSGGWGMVVVYENDLMKWRDITVFDGSAYIANGTPNYGDLVVSGFNAVQQGPIGIKVGMMASEGDVGLTGDQFGILQRGTTTFTQLSHGLNTTNNFFNSSIYVPIESVNPPRNPMLGNNTGIDISMFSIPNETKQHITNSQTSTTFRYSTGGDIYTIFCIVVGIDAYVPEPEAQNIIYTLWEKDGTEIIPEIQPDGSKLYKAYPGSKILYALEIRNNKGTEAIDNMKIQIPIPYTAHFTEGDAWVEFDPNDPYGFTTTQPVFDPFDAAMGMLTWNVGHLPIPADNDRQHLFATLYFKLDVTEDCALLTAAGSCDIGVVIDGLVSGVGHESGVHFEGMRFIYGWVTEGVCQDQPLYLPPFIYVDAEEECSGELEDRYIPVCLSSTATTIPYEAVADKFQRGTRFYDSVDPSGKPTPSSIEYTPTNPFPAIHGKIFYAVPFSITTECYWTFQFEILPLPSFVIVGNEIICAGESVDLSELVTDLDPPQSALYFFSDPAATNLIDPLVYPTQTTIYYVRSNVTQGYGCASEIEPIEVVVKPTGQAGDIIANDLLRCSLWTIEFTASTNNTQIINPVFKWYTSQDAEHPVHTGSTFEIDPIEVLMPMDTTFYVSIMADDDSYCETPPGYRKPVKATILSIPILEVEVPRNYLCGGHTYYELIPKLDEGFDYSVVVPYYWEWYNFATGQFQKMNQVPAGAGIFTPLWEAQGTVPQMYTNYFPGALDFAKDTIIVRFTIEAYCGNVVSVDTLYINAGDPDALFEIVEQPEGLNDICYEKEYIVKITENGDGGLGDIKVTFEDWKASEITFVKAEYLYPIPEDMSTVQDTDWEEMVYSIEDVIYFHAVFPPALNFVLEEGDSVLVRFTVYTDCGFYAGSDYRITLNAKDACFSSAMPPKIVITDKFQIDWGGYAEQAEYELYTSFDNPLIKNTGSGVSEREITWSVSYKLIAGAVHFDRDSLYFNIPKGMTLLSIIAEDLSYLNITDPAELDELETGYDDPINREYKIGLHPDTELGNEIKFEIKFYVEDYVSCGIHAFYLEIIHGDELYCDAIGENCPISQTVAGDYLELEVQLYDFSVLYENSSVYHGTMNINNDVFEYSGIQRIIAETDMYDDDVFTISVYADMNNDGKLDDGDQFILDFDYNTTTCSKDDILNINIPAIPAVEGKQLLLKIHGEHLCNDIVVPVATIFGPQIICHGETVDYLVPNGMLAYQFNIVSTTPGVSPPTRISIHQGGGYLPSDSVVRVVCNNVGNFYVSVRYAIPGMVPFTSINMTLINAQVVERPILGVKAQNENICRNEEIEITQFFQVTNNVASTLTYYKKEADNTLTKLNPDANGLIFVTPWETTIYTATAVSNNGDCDALASIDFKVVVNTMPKIGTTFVTYATCGEADGAIQVSVIGGSGTYDYSFEMDANPYLPLPANGVISGLAAGNYILYVRDRVPNPCPGSVSNPISISSHNGIFAKAEVVIPASECDVADGRIRLIVNGGVPPYEYSLDGIIYKPIPADGLIEELFKAGWHGIVIKDMNTACLAYFSIEVFVETDDYHALDFDLETVTASPCDRNAIMKITAHNGNPPYQYKVGNFGWMPLETEALFSITPGNHSITVKDDDDCAVTKNVTIDNGSGLHAVLGKVKNPNCQNLNGGSIQLTVTGGTPPYTYTIDGGKTTPNLPANQIITGLGIGIYTVTVFDNDGCRFTIDEINLDMEPDMVKAMDNVVYTYNDKQVSGYIIFNDFDMWKYPMQMVPRLDYPLKGGMFEVASFATGYYTYSPPGYPNSSFVGIDSVIYQIVNPCGMTDSAWVIIHVLGYDIKITPPVALQDQYATRMNVPVVGFEVRINDSDPKGQTLTIPVVLPGFGPKFGTLEQDPITGLFTYTPNYGFIGVDRFIYEICNEDGLCATAQAIITVNNPVVMEDYCEATDDYYLMKKYEVLTITDPLLGVLKNDDWPAGGTPNVQVVTAPLHGSVVLNPDIGTLVYTPNPYDYSGPDRFTYRLCTDNTVNCELAFVYIFIMETDCPDSALIVKKDTTFCDGLVIDLNELILDESENIEKLFFYYDDKYTNEMSSTIVGVSGTYYVRAENIYECSSYDSVKVTVLPIADDIHIIVDDVKVCSGNNATISATAPAVTNPTFYLYEDDVATVPLESNYTGNFTIPIPSDVPFNTELTFYIAVSGDNFCENDPLDRKPVTISIYPYPTISFEGDIYLCESLFFTIDATVNAGNDISGMTYRWERFTGTTWALAANMAPANQGNVWLATQQFIYTPLPADYQNGSVLLRALINSPVCGQLQAPIDLWIHTGNPDGTIELMEQPLGLQIACEDTVYVVKITETGDGGLTNMTVILHDYLGSLIKVRKVEYMYPSPDPYEYDETDWIEIDFEEGNYEFIANLWNDTDTLKLQNGASALVRFTVFTECGFYAGADYIFTLDGTDACGNAKIATKHVNTDIYHLDWEGEEVAVFYMDSKLSTNLVTNLGNGNLSNRTITWSVEYVFVANESNVSPDVDNESIYFNIPTGFSIQSIKSTGSYLYLDYDDPVEIDNLFETGYPDPETKEYAIPLYDHIATLTENDTVRFEIVFTVNEDAACDEYNFYIEINHEGELYCDADNVKDECDFYETLARSSQKLTIDLYSFDPYLEEVDNEYHGIMINNKWHGIYRMLPYKPLIKRDVIPIDFYADMNGNGILDAGDIYLMTNTYPTLDRPADVPFPLVAGATVHHPDYPGGSAYFDSIPAIEYKQLLGVPVGPHVCDVPPVPLVTIFGKNTVCEGDTALYRTAAGMINYLFTTSIVSGAALPLRLPLQGQTAYTANDSIARFVFAQPGVYNIAVKYQLPTGPLAGRYLNRTLMRVTVVPKPILEIIGAADTTICAGQPVEISHFIKDAVAENEGLTTFYYERKEADGTYTPIGEGAPFTVTVWNTTTYRVSAATNCRSKNAVEFTINVDQPVRIASIWVADQPSCTQPTGAITFDALGGSGDYSYSIGNNPFDWVQVASSDQFVDITGLTAGTYTFYLKDNVMTKCPPAVSEPITLRPYDSYLNVKAVVDSTYDCSTADAEVTLNVSGGHKPYQYSVDGGATYNSLPTNGKIAETFGVGRYTFFVKDATGCEVASQEAVVWPKNGLELTLTQIYPADCDGLGMVKIEVSGGVEPYSYRVNSMGWMPMLGDTDSTLVFAGAKRYIYVKDASDCEVMGWVSIENTEPDLSIFDIVTTPARCGDYYGTISFKTTGNEPQWVSFDGNRDMVMEVINNEFSINVAIGIHEIMLFGENECVVVEDKVKVDREDDIPEFDTEDAEICEGETVDLQALVTPIVNVSYVSFYETNSYSTPMTNTAVGTEKYYYVRAFNNFDCYWSDSLYVKVNPAPIVSIIPFGKDTAECSNTPVTFVLSTLAFVDKGDIQFSVNKNFNPLITSIAVPVGEFRKVYVRGYDPLTDCYTPADKIDSVTMRVHPLPTITITPVAPLCVDADPVTLAATPTGGTFSGDGVNGGVFDPADAGVGTHTITYDYTDANGCSNSETIDITVHALPTLSITPVAPLCVDAAPVTLTATPTGGTFSGDGVSNGVFDPADAGVGTHTITYDYTDVNGCSNSETIQITVNGFPTVDILVLGKDTAVCSNSAVTFDLTQLVTVNNGVPQFSLTNFGSLITPQEVTVAPGGVTKVYVRGYNATTGCTTLAGDIDSVTMRVHPIPTVDILVSGKDSSVCSNSSITFNLPELVAITNGVPQFSLNKSFDMLITPQEVTVDPGGVTKVYVRGYNTTTGCTTMAGDIDSVTMRVHAIPTVDILVAGKDTSVCSNSSITFNLPELVAISNGVPQFSLNKSFDPLIDPQTTTVAVGGVTKVFVRGYNTTTGCTTLAGDIDSVTMRVHAIPTIDVLVSGKDTSVCSNSSITFNLPELVAISNGVPQFSLNKSFDPLIDPQTTTVAVGGVTKVYVRGYNATTGCTTLAGDIDSVTMRVHAIPTVDILVLGKDTSVCSNSSITFNLPELAAVTNGVPQFSLNKSFDPLITPQEVIVAPNGVTKVYVRGYNATTGCTTLVANIDSVTMRVHPIPTVDILVSGKDTSVCSNSSITFNLPELVAITNGVPQFSLNKSFDPLIDPQTTTVAVGGVTKVYVRGYNTTTGCTTLAGDIDSVTMRVHSIPTVDILVSGKDTSVCSNSSITFNLPELVAITNGVPQFSLNKSFDMLITPQEVIVAPNGVTKVYVRGYNATTGCTTLAANIDSVTMRVNPRPVVTLTGDYIFMECSDTPVEFDLTDKVTTNFGVVQYSESMSGPWLTPITNYLVQVNEHKDLYFRAYYDVTTCYTDDNGIIMIRLRVNPVVKIEILERDTVVCSNSDIVFDLNELATAIGGDLLFNELYDEGYATWNYVTDPHPWTVTVDETKTIYYRAIHIDEDDNKCWSTIDSVIMHVYSLPAIETNILTKDTSVCSDIAVTFDLRTLVTITPPTDRQIMYSIDPAGTYTIGNFYTVNPDATQKLYFKAYYDVTGCETADDAIDSVTLNVHSFPLAPVIVLVPLYVIPNNYADLTTAVEHLPNMTYTYYENANKTGKITDPTNVQYVLPKDDYYVSATNEFGCEGPVSLITLMNPCFAHVVNTKDDALCTEADYHFNLNDYAEYANELGNSGWLVFSTVRDFLTVISTPEDYVVAINTSQTIYIKAYDEVEECYSLMDSIKLTVYFQPLAPVITLNPLYADPDELIDLSKAVQIIPGLTYIYYENADKTGKLTGSIIKFDISKLDEEGKLYYYVSASNAACEGDISEIILKRRCPVDVTDAEGNIYKVTSLAKLCWTENLKTTINPVTNEPIVFAKPYTCNVCLPNLEDIFGLLYTWYSAVGEAEPNRNGFVQGICPNGWHIPPSSEWELLNQYDGKKLKSTMYWLNPPGPGTDDYGFDARPAGWYNGSIERFVDLYGYTGWWASDNDGGENSAKHYWIAYYCDYLQQSIKKKIDGLSVRCVLDYDPANH